MALDNAGTATFNCRRHHGMALENGAGIDNQPGGSFTIRRRRCDHLQRRHRRRSSRTQGSLTRRRPAGDIGAIVQPAFTQTGTGSTLVQAGESGVRRGGTVSGSMTGAAGTKLALRRPLDQLRCVARASAARGLWGSRRQARHRVAGSYDVTGSTTGGSAARVTFTRADHRPGDRPAERGRRRSTSRPTSRSASTSLEITAGTDQRRRREPDGHRLDELGRWARSRDSAH